MNRLRNSEIVKLTLALVRSTLIIWGIYYNVNVFISQNNIPVIQDNTYIQFK